jgi:hypothetical protein
VRFGGDWLDGCLFDLRDGRGERGGRVGDMRVVDVGQ